MAAAHGTLAVEGLLAKLHSLNTMQCGLNEKIAADTLEQAHKARLVALQLRLFQEAVGGGAGASGGAGLVARTCGPTL